MKKWVLIPEHSRESEDFWESWIYFYSKEELLKFVKENNLKIIEANKYNPKMIYVKGEIK